MITKNDDHSVGGRAICPCRRESVKGGACAHNDIRTTSDSRRRGPPPMIGTQERRASVEEEKAASHDDDVRTGRVSVEERQ
jgi:hypothetical protein